MPAAVSSVTRASARLASGAGAGGAAGQAVPQGGFRRFWRALKQLFHEVTGAMFAILAFVWISKAFRAWTGDVARWLIVLAVVIAAIFTFYAISSFRRAQKL
ncbi:MAG: hypothetical protein ABSG69_00690 [Candidatus Acidiferrum sp.]|jgi:type IV secretory pathway VirB2 component (pilin)